MPRNPQGVYSLPPGSIVALGEAILPSQHNPPLIDIASELNGVVLTSGDQSVAGQKSFSSPVRGPVGTAAAPAFSFSGDTNTGIFRDAANAIGLATDGVRRAVLTSTGFQVDVPVTGTAVTQSDADTTAGRLLRTGAGPAQAFRRGNILGAVSQSAGTPTGAVIQRGSNANGEFVRFADGTQICWNEAFSLGPPNIALGSAFESAAETWVFPASFASGSRPSLSASGSSDSRTLFAFFGGSNSSEASLRAIRTSSSALAQTARLVASGRWF